MKPVDFQIALFKGTEAAKGYLFNVSLGELSMRFVVHKRAKQWRVTHFDTGLCVYHGTNTRSETFAGFKDAVLCGLFKLEALAHKATHSPTINTLAEVAQ